MPVDHRERTFEAAVEDSLLADGGYTRAAPTDFDQIRCFDPGPLLAFVKETQATTCSQIVFDGALQGIFVDRMEQNHELFAELMSDQALKDVVTRRLRQDVYECILAESDATLISAMIPPAGPTP